MFSVSAVTLTESEYVGKTDRNTRIKISSVRGPHFPDIYPDELLYSQLCRYYQRTGYTKYIFAVDDLFMRRTVHPVIEWVNEYSPDAMNHITRGTDFETVVREHTMFPAYTRFLPKERRGAALQSLIVRDGNYYNLIVNQKVNHKRYLRYCPLCAGEDRRRELAVTVMSFGFKHGIPLEADLVFDVRFLPNPYYVESLQPLSGLDRPVAEYVFQHTQTREFLEKLEDMIAFLLPYYKEEGKVALTVAIGCTGGRHRSVAIAAALHQHLVANGVNSVNVNRDIHK